MRRQKPILFFVMIAITVLFVYVAMNGLGFIQSVPEDMKLGLDIEGGVVVVYEAETEESGTELRKLMEQTKNVLSRRIDTQGLVEPNIALEGEKRIRIELPGQAQEAIEDLEQPFYLTFELVADGQEFVMLDMTSDMYEGRELFSGKEVSDAGITYDENGKPAVSFTLTDEGQDIFTAASREIVEEFENGRGQIAILLDGKVISAPSVNQLLPGKDLIIEGSFTLEEAGKISGFIRSGAVPVKLKEVQSKIIGPTLGRSALDISINAAKVGLVLLVLFMIIYYRLPGLVASINLILYATLVLFILVGLNATLTLSGVIGMILSIGMAVDANVIIFERIREELQVGKSIRASIDAGFKRAIRTIMDSNVTTLIAAVVLYNFGEGPIKGFAITLGIGIGASMFTAIVITRYMMKSMVSIKMLNNKKLFRG